MKIDGSLPGAPDELRKEAVFLYKAAFNKSIPDTLLERYLRAHADLTKQLEGAPFELQIVKTIIEKNLDPVGIEPWLRKKGRQHHLLTRKLLLLSFLNECGGNPAGISRSPDRFALPCMALTVCAAALALLRGRIQAARYGLV
jgi:hypothetical protein